MKIAVYAIARNEGKFVDRWMDSMGEADAVFVLDTGSEDDTVERLRARGATVAQWRMEPFRFDHARNASLAMVPDEFDWCACTDLDEYFTKGWRAILESRIAEAEAAGENPTAATCLFVTSFHDDGTPKDSMDYWKIHRRGAVEWRSPIHEYLAWDKGVECRKVWCDGFRLEHHPDPTKSRAQYLDLLEIAAHEDPCPRHLFYLGREYMFRGRPMAAMATLQRYLAHPEATWRPERAWAYRFMARLCRDAKEYNCAIPLYCKAAAECGDQRESLVEYARMCRELGLEEESLRAMACAVARKNRPRVFFTEDECWDGTPERLLSEWSKKKETK